MEVREFKPKTKQKILTKEFLAKYTYILLLSVLLIGGISYGYTFFTQNKKIADGSITTAGVTINFTNRNINATELFAPINDQEGLSEFSKTLTITNTTSTSGRIKLSLTRTSGLLLSDMRYALIVNNNIQKIADVPVTGELLSSAIMGNETLNVEIRLWPKSSYSGSETTFAGEITPEIKYLGVVGAELSNLSGKYVNFNCNTACEIWRIVKIENGRLVLTRQNDYSGATGRVNSNHYNANLEFNDNTMITSVSTDNKNVYLAKTVKIVDGNGREDNPYILENNDYREDDKKVVAVVTYKNGNDIVGTQNIYYGDTNYIFKSINDPDFVGWSTTSNGTTEYVFGDIYDNIADQTLYAVMRQRLLSTIKKNADSETQINFGEISSSTNGEGLYVLRGTVNNTNPIYYYRGNVNNNNVIFGGFCWQIVRTTDTGGIKMVYNGVATNDESTCENINHEDRIISSTDINVNQNSVADVGYMYNKKYYYKNDTPTEDAYFGTSAEYGDFDEDETYEYRLVAPSQELNDTHHYSCDLISDIGTCTKLRYYFSDTRYIELEDGELIEDALYKMTGTATTEVKNREINQNYTLNVNDSKLKTTVENWFKINLTNEVDNTKTDYRGYIEDTTYCNDLTFKTVAGNPSYPIYQNSGWSPAGSLSNFLYFASYNRYANDWYNTTNVPNFECPNVTDQFRLNNLQAKLNYPVGLLTADEMILAGSSQTYLINHTNHYLYTGGNFWSMSPSAFETYYSTMFSTRDGRVERHEVNIADGIRPVISLKSSVEYKNGGDGTPTNPYIIK